MLIVAVEQAGEAQQVVDHILVDNEDEASTASAVALALTALALSGG